MSLPVVMFRETSIDEEKVPQTGRISDQAEAYVGQEMTLGDLFLEVPANGSVHRENQL